MWPPPAQVSSDPLLRQRIAPHLDVYGARLGALTALLQPWRAVAVRAPQAATFPAGARIVDTAIQALGKKAQRVRNAQHDHLPIPERDEAVIEVGGPDRDVVAQAHRVVVVHPGVVARVCGSVLEAREARARVLVVREPFRAVVASCGGSIERPLAFTPLETHQCAV